MSDLPKMYGVSDTVSTKGMIAEEKGSVDIKRPNKREAKIKSGNTELTVPTVEYVRELETRLEAAERDNKKMKSDMTNYRNAFNALSAQVNEMKKALKGKMDKF